MSALSREEFIELGVSIPTAVVTEWATGRLSATKGRESRLELRGVTAASLSGSRDLIDLIERRRRELGESQALPPEAAALAERIRAEAIGYWREAKRLANAAFATQPDVLAEFRVGVKTGLLIMKLVRELETTVALMRVHAATFAALGAGETFITRGELLIARLKKAKSTLDAACGELSATALQQCHDKGVLYDLTRTLVRIGRLEFALEAEVAKEFNFDLVRRDRGVATSPKRRKQNVEKP